MPGTLDTVLNEGPNVASYFIRPEDLVVLRVKFYNYELSGAGTAAAKLVRRAGANASHCILRVKFPPQCFDERVFSSVTSPDGIVTPVAGNNTRLDFLIPAEQAEIGLPQGTEGLLAFMRQWPLALPSAPAPTKFGPYVTEVITTNPHSLPLPTETHTPIVGAATRIELPFDLYLAPNARTRWVHAPQPVGRPGSDGRNWFELWHTGASRPTSPPVCPTYRFARCIPRS